MENSHVVKWGILGAGIIARKLANAMQETSESKLHAVASKSAQRAGAFAKEFDISKSYSYDELVSDNEIDIIYIATTNNFHYENGLLALNAGKPVLMEKPFTVNYTQAEELSILAKSKGLFMMEGMWVRFLPIMIRLKEILHSGTIGNIRQVTVTFGKFVSPQFADRLKDPELGGGVTLDMGIYPVSVVSYLLGEIPSDIRSFGRFTNRGIDETANYLFRFPSGCLAQISTSFNLKMQNTLMIYGEKGYIEMEGFPSQPEFTINLHDSSNQISSSEHVALPQNKNGFVYQVEECVRCLKEGLQESPVLPVSETLSLMKILDSMRADWNFAFPFE